jgi:hypothetical protein
MLTCTRLARVSVGVESLETTDVGEVFLLHIRPMSIDLVAERLYFRRLDELTALRMYVVGPDQRHEAAQEGDLFTIERHSGSSSPSSVYSRSRSRKMADP